MKLNPCPDCETSDRLSCGWSVFWTVRGRYHIECRCGFCGPSAVTKRRARLHWNRYTDEIERKGQ